jgi:hypothetical protein
MKRSDKQVKVKGRGADNQLGAKETGDVVVGTKLIRNFLLRELALRRWLEQILVEDLTQAGGEGPKQPTTIWDHLKDGVLLCRVMLTLKPNSVPKIHEEKAVFRRKENLFFFLEALDEHDFPVKKKFTVADLYEEKNLVKVLYVTPPLPHTYQCTVCCARSSLRFLPISCPYGR